MSIQLKPYPEYIYPGVMWLGKVPEHWDVRKLKQVVSIAASNVSKESVDGESKVLLCNYTDVYYHSEITRSLKFMQATATLEQAKRFQLKKGDVLITKDSESFDDIGVPAVVTEELNMVLCGYHLALLRPKKMMDGNYLRYALESSPCREHFHISANGITRYGLSISDIGTAAILSPPLDEQEAIGRFVRHLDHRVNRLLKTKRRLIELLNEQKQAIIHRAVTRGLDPDVRLKPSGVEWLGEVPEHWEVKRIKHLVNMKSGDNITAERIEQQGDYPVYGGNGLRGFTDKYNHIGDFALIGRQGALCGNINYASGQFWASEHAVVCNPIKPFVTEWLGEMLRIMNLNQYSVSAAQPGLAVDRIKSLQLPVPPFHEQDDIVKWIAAETVGLKIGITKTRREIDFIREYRTRLVSDVVTGQLDVRGLDLPEVEEIAISMSEDLDEEPGEDGEGAEE